MRRVELADALPRAAEIVADVRERGDQALLEWTERLDGDRPASIRVSAEAIATAEAEPAFLAALERLAGAVREFHALQRPPDTAVSTYPGVRVARRFVPIRSVGIYAPGGRAAYPSSLVMAAVPAQVAGVERIAVASPRPAPALLAAARVLGIDEVYAVGGAQAIAALAYGTETVAPVDKIVGPGNRWVAAAKLLVSGRVGIDLPAGPSEVMVVADETADPELCAADLLAQAEHGPDSECILVTTSAELGREVEERTAGWEQVSVEVVGSLDEALTRVDAYAPEHLELHVSAGDVFAAQVRNAGSIFVGSEAPAVVGDYAAGANHVLPTGGLARAAGGLGLDSFLKPIQIVSATREGLDAMRGTIGALAAAEGLPLHAAAVEARFREVPA
ncbi:MAG TPA: histidinol dehydrogenase [Gaiellaceae bacterium]|nr:histidinol dehydrogenase [Gaiellaceae bacterium]